MQKFVTICLLVTCFAGVWCQKRLHNGEMVTENGGIRMNTNVALVGSRKALADLTSDGQQNLAVVDPSALLDEASKKSQQYDIEEDPNDPFITTRAGKRRTIFVNDDNEWIGEKPIAAKLGQFHPGALSRKKRCGDGDGGDARRARRARRIRRARRARRARQQQARAARESTKTATTTVTRKVIQNGQVVSQTTETQQPGQVIVQQQPAQPVVQTVQQPQPVIIQQQPAVAQQPVMAQQPAASTAALPSISVNGSVKVN